MTTSFIQKGARNILQKQPHDVVILSALRTPSTRSYKGGLKDAYDHELLYHVLRATLKANHNLDPRLITDTTIGTVLSELGGSKAGRMAAIAAGLPSSTAFSTVNRACSSGHSAITSIAHSIALGQMDVGIGGGMESMTRDYGSKAIPTQLWDGLRNSETKDARDCIMSMGLTAENVAERYGVSRQDQDSFAAASQQKAVEAQKAGLFKKEIVPVPTRWTDPKDPNAAPKDMTINSDDGVRMTTPEKLASMKPAFKEDGTATAGNSSQISDGAAAVLMMRRSTATSLGLSGSVVGKWAGSQVVGCAPDEMGIGPAVAIPRLLEYTGVSKEEVGIWEINEAFASQVLHCIRTLGIDMDRVNPKGGAIALGHPLGATGARQLATLLPEMDRQGKELGVVSACVGTGMGYASLFVRE
ncbi:MAG: hypothetical protein M1828_000491 [Chrysothrix sp. TS-e1954]|nr:MAG: hypothetical protein M1828_000491 [Chrysothrix sp. TS-e1954]